MKTITLTLLALLSMGQAGMAFCGFYVAKADAKVFNESSQVIIARNGQRSTITMSSDFQGDLKEFAMVVPVPVVLGERDIRVADRLLFDKLDAYSAPRMAEYYDPNPCYQERYDLDAVITTSSAPMSKRAITEEMAEDEYKVTIEAEYTVGEYDILILSAEESDGLNRWLTDNDYKVPDGAQEVLEPYIKNDMKFFVVKVNMEKQKALGYQTLRPLQVTFESPKFMLPIRLGMANANGPQDMIVYILSQKGRVEAANYRTVKIPTNDDVPLFVEDRFGEFYKAVFDRAYNRENGKTVFLEYAWDLSSTNNVKCDPCVSPPPIFSDMREAGADWLTVANNGWGGSGYSGNAFFTRLHVRYSRSTFPQDLVFMETPNRERFQGRYVIHHPATGDLSCEGAEDYYTTVLHRREKELQNLAALTGWSTDRYSHYTSEYLRKLDKAQNQNKLNRGSVFLFLTSFDKMGPIGAVLILSLVTMIIIRLKSKRSPLPIS